mmetsp:Transcript_19735/g.48493  ORF Transcript_19735/g.48493 Transcript_19735/m.48493 type:complete len:210 (-) Transcript_19735:876-1505(-)
MIQTNPHYHHQYGHLAGLLKTRVAINPPRHPMKAYSEGLFPISCPMVPRTQNQPSQSLLKLPVPRFLLFVWKIPMILYATNCTGPTTTQNTIHGVRRTILLTKTMFQRHHQPHLERPMFPRSDIIPWPHLLRRETCAMETWPNTCTASGVIPKCPPCPQSPPSNQHIFQRMWMEKTLVQWGLHPLQHRPNLRVRLPPTGLLNRPVHLQH